MHKHPYGNIREGKIYLNAFLNFPERKIGEVKESDESTIRYFEERFLAVENKVKEIEEAINQSENKGSYLMKLIHLKQSLLTHEGLGNYEPLFNKLECLEKDLIMLISHNREKNLEIKKALIEDAKQIQSTHDFKAGAEKFKELSEKWIKTGNVEKELEEEIENTFNAIKDDFFARRKSYYDDKKLLVQARIKKYEEIIEAIKKTDSEGNLPATVKTIKDQQEKWKLIGEIPAKVNKELWTKLKNVTDPIFERYKNSRNTSESKKNNHVNIVSHKKQLIQQVEDLCLNPSNEDQEKLKKLQTEWKKSNEKSKDKKDPLKAEFFIACDKARELTFLNKIAQAKNKGFNQKPYKDQIKIKIYILKDLLNRDLRDLSLFKENSQKFSSDTNSFNDLLHNKLIIQERKVEIKKMILDNLQAQLLEKV